MVHVNEAVQFARLCMVDSELGTTGRGGTEVVQWPAVVEIYMMMKIRYCIKRKTRVP